MAEADPVKYDPRRHDPIIGAAAIVGTVFAIFLAGFVSALIIL